MVNLVQELQNYPVIDLRNVDPNVADNIRNSVILYNKAIESIRAQSEDIAIIELKKAIALYPEFHQAMNLLGLCYCYIKEYEKAADIFNKVIKAENNSILAQKYLRYIDSFEDELSVPRSGKKKTNESSSSMVNQRGKAPVSFLERLKKNGKFELVGYTFIGLVLGIALTVTVIFAFSGNNGSGKNSAALNTTAIQSDKTLEDKYNKLSEEYNNLKKSLDEANKQVDYYKNVIKLSDAELLVSNGKYEAAADILVLLKDIKFKDADKAKFDRLYQDTMSKAAQSAYYQGFAYINQKKYKDAITEFSKIQVYVNNFPNMDSVLYNMGKCYTYLNDSRSAVDAFQKVKAAYPDSKYAVWADNRIKELTAIP